MKRRLLAMLLAFCLCVSLLPVAALAEDTATGDGDAQPNASVVDSGGADTAAVAADVYTAPADDPTVTDSVYDSVYQSVYSMTAAVALVPAAVTTATVTVTVQYNGTYRTFKDLAVSSDTAESYGYTEDTTQGVSMLDALFTVHREIFGASFTHGTMDGDNWSNAYLSIGTYNTTGTWAATHIIILKMFGVTTFDTASGTYLGDFTVNGVIPNSGWYPCHGGIAFFYPNEVTLNAGDVVQFFTVIDTASQSDKYVWLEYKGAVASWKNAITVARDTDVTLTAKQVDFYTQVVTSASLSELQAQSEAARNMKLGYVDIDTGAITPIANAVTAKDGSVTLQFPKTNEDEQQVYYIAAYSDNNPAIINLTEVIAVDEMGGGVPSVASVTVKPVATTSATGRLVVNGGTWYATNVALGDQITFKAYDENGRELTRNIAWTDNQASELPIDPATGILTISDSRFNTAGQQNSTTITATYTYTDADGQSVVVSGTTTPYFLSGLALANKTCAIDNGNISTASDSMSPTGPKYQPLVSYSVDDPDGAVSYTVSSSSIYPRLNYTAVRPGVVYIACYETGNEANNYATATLTVSNLFVRTPDGATQNATLYVGDELQLSAHAARGATVAWSSGTGSAATVDSAGQVTAIAPGTAVITATDSKGNSGAITVLIKARDDYGLDYLYLNAPSNTYYSDSSLSSTTLVKGAASYYKGVRVGVNDVGILLSGGSAFTQNYYIPNYSSLTVELAAFFDSGRVAAEVWRNGVKFADCANGGYVDIPMNANPTVVTVKTCDKTGDGAEAYRQYTFSITKTGSTAYDRLAIPTVAVVTGSGRANYTGVLCNGQAEGTIFQYKASSTSLTKTSYMQTDYSYCAFVYQDAGGIDLTLADEDQITGHVRYSLDGGVTWTECPATTYTPGLSFGAGDSISVLVQSVADSVYLANKSSYGDGWHSGQQAYPVTVYRLPADPAAIRLDDLEFTDNCTEGTPRFDPAGGTAFALVSSRANTAGLKFRADEEQYTVKLGTSQSSLYDAADSGVEQGEGGYYNLAVLMGSVDSGSGAYTAANLMNYCIALSKTESVAVSGNPNTFPLEILRPYAVTLSRRADSNNHANVVDYVVPDSYYTNSYNTGTTYNSYFPEQTLASGNTSLKALGDFGGHITYYFPDGIQNSPNNPYGIDFVIYDSENGTYNTGAVYVSENGTDWYELAGSAHYEAATTWNYSKTYTPGNSIYPSPEFYPLHDFSGEQNAMTATGTLVGTATAALAWGYVGINSGTSGYADPYGAGLMSGGNGFDLAWAVDQDGNPVALDTVRYVKVMSAANITVGNQSSFETCAKVQQILPVSPGSGAICQTPAPASITVGNTTIHPEAGVFTYYAAVDSFETVSTAVTAPGANVYINNSRSAGRTYQAGSFDSQKGIIRIVVQSGACEPLIYYVHVVTTAVVTAMIEALPANVTVDDEAAVTAAHSAFDALSEGQQAEISEANRAKLESVWSEYSAASIARVKSLIAAIGEVTLASGDRIAAARSAYNRLTADQKAGVDTYGALAAAEVQYLEALIDAIDLKNISAATAAAVDAATAAYDALNDDEKATISQDGYDAKLATAQNVYPVLAVITLIDGLPAANSNSQVLLAAAEAIEDANYAYEVLTAQQKTMLGNNTARLNAVYSAYRIANDESLIALIKDPVNLLARDAVAAAQVAYDKLTIAEQARIDSDTNYKLSKASDIIVQLTAYQSKALTLLNNYPDRSKYSGDNAAALAAALAAGVAAINAACDKDGINAALAAAEASADAVPTDAQAPPFSGATLSALALSSGTLSPAFASATTGYTASVENSAGSITVTPTASESHAAITVNGAPVTSGSASGPITLNVGSNTVTVQVIAQDGITTQTYTVTVTRAAVASSDATLSALFLSSGTLSPAFASTTAGYTASVGNSTGSITVTPTASNTNATITVNGTPVTSGSASGPITLNVGSNTVTVLVTAKDGTTTKTYTVTVTRAEASSPSPGGGGGPSTPSAVTSTTGSATVTPSAGGAVSLGNDATVKIPSGALNGTSGVTVSVQKLDSPPAAPSGFTFLGTAYEFSVGGQESYDFSKPVTLTFTFDPASLAPGQTPSVYYYNQGKDEWVNLGGTVSGHTVTVTVDHFTKYAVLARAAKEAEGQTAPTQVPAQTFSDVPASYWASAVITELSGRGIFTGYPDGTFKPDSSITRAEFATLLVKALGLPAAVSPVEFKDVPADAWFHASVESAVYAGLAGGLGDGAFAPNAPITREQMAVITVKALENAGCATSADTRALDGFSDRSSVDGWALQDLAKAVNTGLVHGTSDTAIAPLEHATRAQAASMIETLLKLAGKL